VCCSVFQRVAACCSVSSARRWLTVSYSFIQCCNVLQCVAAVVMCCSCCNVLQRSLQDRCCGVLIRRQCCKKLKANCNTLQLAATVYIAFRLVLQCVVLCCSVLQIVCCSVLQCVAACCGVLQCVAVCCSVLQCVAVYCIVLQCVAVCCRSCVAVCCRVLQCVADRVVQCVAVCCRSCVAVCCSMFPLDSLVAQVPMGHDTSICAMSHI